MMVPEESTEESAMGSFARILSKAVGGDESLRAFIKDAALKKFDKDYDVFYPFVKDEELTNGMTFRNTILGACESEDELLKIEDACPKLTILVPDWSWIGTFNAEVWDTSSEDVLVGYAQDGGSHTLYKDGEVYMVLCPGEIPETPTLIVKENERMRYNVGTRGVDAYEFADPAFDGSKKDIETRGRQWYEDDINLSYEVINDFVPASDIDPILVSAYNEFGNSYYGAGCHRDYVYYGMSKTNQDNGEFNEYIRERFYRFKINPTSFTSISDDTNDPKLSDDIKKTGSSNQLNADELMKKIWSGGSFEFRFSVFMGTEGLSTTTSSADIVCYATGQQLFDLTKVHRRYKHQTAIARGEYIYKFLPENLVPKWVYPMGEVYLPKWDISKNSNNIYISAIEYDPSGTSKKTESKVFKYSKNFSFKAEVSLGKWFKTSLGVESSTEKNESSSLEREITLTSDYLGIDEFPYESRIIQNSETRVINGASVFGYSVKPVDFGAFSITFLPKDIRR